MTTLLVPATTDFTGSTLSNIDLIEFANASGTTDAIFLMSQFGGTGILANVAIKGTTAVNRIFATGTSIDASLWTFSSWRVEGSADFVNLTGTVANDTIVGSQSVDIIQGGDGDDSIDSKNGDDTVNGGVGNDTFFYDRGSNDSIDGGPGVLDTMLLSAPVINSGPSFLGSLQTIVNVERIVFDPLSPFAVGTQFLSKFFGPSGGIVEVVGSAKQDALGVQASGPARGLIDMRGVAFSTWSAADIVRLTASSSSGNDIYGSSQADDIRALGTGINHVEGDGGDDSLQITFEGSARGGAGDDTYVEVKDTILITEFPGEGIDTVTTRLATYTLDDNFENVTFLDTGGHTGTGNGLVNSLTGNIGADTLDGGAGGDNLIGGKGDDIYYVDNAGDMVLELANEGYDTVHTTTSVYTLAANVERLYNDAATAYTAIGNASNNTIYGNNGDDRFRDYNLGIDKFSGGNGSDAMYYTGVGAAVLNFATGIHGGSALGDAFASVENFFGSNTGGDTMTGGAGRAIFNGQGGNDALNGGANHDKLYGGAGLDTLSGGGGNDLLYGGAGNDTMTGGAARDYFVYTETAASGGWGADVVTDFQDGVDLLKFANVVANAFADFTITGNGTANVLVTLAAAPANSVVLHGAGPITLTAADFLFY